MNECNEDSWKIVYIPEKPPILPLPQATVNVYAAMIEPKDTNTLVRKLNQIAPLENLRHVKRVRKLRLEGGSTHICVILCLAGESDSQLDGLPENMLGLIGTYQLSTFITKVCKYSASSKEEWEEQCKIWPTSYHPPTYIAGITGFSDEESKSTCTFMKMALDLASCGCQVVNAAVIVDPLSNQLIASACDEVHSYSLNINNTSIKTYCCEQEANISSFANIKENRKNLLSKYSANEPKRLNDGVSCLNPWGWSDQNICFDSYSWHPLRHAAIVAIEHSAARDRCLFPGSGHSVDAFTEADYMQSSSACPSSKKQKTNFTNVKDNEKQNCDSNGCHSELVRPYLCTGYDIYLVWEPCIMCAMALIHQRVKRIFYAYPNSVAGALGSVHRLQGEKSLNHHYAVFNVLVPEDFLDGPKKYRCLENC